MVVKFPCKICNAVAKNHHAVQCDHCQLRVHIKCNKINLQTYKFLQKSSFVWYCIKCLENIIPFSTISDHELFQTNKGKKIKFKVLTKKNILTNHYLIDKLNNAMDDPESEMLSSKYYEPNEMATLFKNKNKHISFFHLNISSLPFHFEELLALIAEHNLSLDFLGISESRLKLNQNPLTSLQLPGYNIEYTPTECNNRGTLLYIKKGMNYKLRKDLQIYKPKQLESTFIEVVQNKDRIIIGCLYRHLSMELSEFNYHYLSNLLDNLSDKSKTVVLPGDFNADLLKYDKDCNVSDFLDTMYSNLLLPHIASPTRVTLNSETLIDNIFSNNYDSSFTSGNLVTTLSDHHAQSLLMGFQNKQMDNEKIQIIRDFSKIENNKNLINTHLEGIDWATELQVNSNNADLSSELFLKKIEQLINFWAPFQRVPNKKKKLQNKPWITKGLLKSIETKNRLNRKIYRTKDPLKREELVNKVKTYKKYILHLTKKVRPTTLITSSRKIS